MDHGQTSQQALYWQVPGYKRRSGRPRANQRSTVNNFRPTKDEVQDERKQQKYKNRKSVKLFMRTHLRATKCHLPYDITQC